MAKSTTKVITRAPKTETEVYGDQRFYVCNGQYLSKLSDLSGSLRSMDDGTYTYHVNNGRNDFSNWISDVFLNKPLSQKISKAKTRSAAADLIDTYIKG